MRPGPPAHRDGVAGSSTMSIACIYICNYTCRMFPQWGFLEYVEMNITTIIKVTDV